MRGKVVSIALAFSVTCVFGQITEDYGASTSLGGIRLDNPAYDADSQNYFLRVLAAGGILTSPGSNEYRTKTIFDFFVRELKSTGLWASITELGIMGIGVGNLNAALVKVKGAGTLTNNNFVAGDLTPYGAALGLKGDGSTKYLSTGVDQNTLSQNNLSMWVYVTNAVTSSLSEILIGGVNVAGGVNFWKDPSPATGVIGRISSASTTGSVGTYHAGLVGFSRTSATNVNWVTNTLSGNVTLSSAAIPSGIITPFARSGAAGHTRSAISLYGFGTAIDLAALRTACDNLHRSFGFAP